MSGDTEMSHMASQMRNAQHQAVPAVKLFNMFYVLLCGCSRKDGDVYRSLLEVAQRSPFNDTEEGPAWKPVLESRLNPKLRASSKL